MISTLPIFGARVRAMVAATLKILIALNPREHP
jgi:hypothetical protein